LKKTNTKTSLSVILQPKGGAKIDMKWSDLDSSESNHNVKASERIMLEVIKIPEYKWLIDFVTKHLTVKYCDKCTEKLNIKAQCRDVTSTELKPFPYCFIPKDNE